MKRNVAFVLHSILLATVAALWGSDAAAAPVTQVYSNSYPLTQTNWSSTLAIPKYNPAFGTLLKVEIDLHGHVEGSAGYENISASSANIHLELKANLLLTKPDATPLLNVMPTVTKDELASAFDGVVNFAGTSGTMFPNLIGDALDTITLNAPADLALFLGSGDILLPISAKGQSAGSGAGNLALLFNTRASGEIEVTYTYEPTAQLPVPEPTTGALLCLGLAGLAARRRFKKNS